MDIKYEYWNEIDGLKSEIVYSRYGLTSYQGAFARITTPDGRVFQGEYSAEFEVRMKDYLNKYNREYPIEELAELIFAAKDKTLEEYKDYLRENFNFLQWLFKDMSASKWFYYPEDDAKTEAMYEVKQNG